MLQRAGGGRVRRGEERATWLIGPLPTHSHPPPAANPLRILPSALTRRPSFQSAGGSQQNTTNVAVSRPGIRHLPTRGCPLGFATRTGARWTGSAGRTSGIW
jgi:hypothetical protein